MSHCFGGTKIKLKSKEIENGGVNIDIEGIKTFLSLENKAREIAEQPYGYMVAEEFVENKIKHLYKKSHFKKKE